MSNLSGVDAKIKCFVPLIVFLFSFCSCMPFAPSSREKVPQVLPSDYVVSNNTSVEMPEKWWHTFNSTEINTLLKSLWQGNLKLEQAWARMEQARQTAKKSKSSFYPGLNAQAGYSYTREHRESTSPRVDSDTNSKSFSLGLALNYELDLWGKIRSQARSGSYEYRASRQDLYATALSLSAQAVKYWITIRSLQKRQQVLNSKLQVYEKLLRLTRERYLNAISPGTEVLDIRQTLSRTRSQLPKLVSREQENRHALAVLLGKSPGAELGEINSELPRIPKVPQEGLKAGILYNRPDIKAAWMRIKASDWSVAAARADRLPNITLSANPKYMAEELSSILDNWMISLAADLSLPLVDGGRKRAEVKRIRTKLRERIAAYKQTVLTAVQEVEDALTLITGQEKKIEDLIRQKRSVQSGLELTRLRYKNGMTSYTAVLNKKQSLLGVQENIIQAKTDALRYRVDLYKAAGTDIRKQITKGKKQVGGGKGTDP